MTMGHQLVQVKVQSCSFWWMFVFVLWELCSNMMFWHFWDYVRFNGPCHQAWWTDGYGPCSISSHPISNVRLNWPQELLQFERWISFPSGGFFLDELWYGNLPYFARKRSFRSPSEKSKRARARSPLRCCTGSWRGRSCTSAALSLATSLGTLGLCSTAGAQRVNLRSLVSGSIHIFK